jgi:hypothetical protein
MIVCPVCEHQQAQGAECEVCGKRLAAGAAAAALAIPSVEGLEPTLHAAAGAPPADQVAELEPTLHATSAAVPAFDVTPDLEATRAAPVDVDAAPVADLERTATSGIPDDGPTSLPAFVTCRYCRTPAMPGERFCARCGMRVPVLAGADAAAGVGPGAEAARICSCGTPVRPGATLCRHCGARHS